MESSETIYCRNHNREMYVLDSFLNTQKNMVKDNGDGEQVNQAPI